MSLTDQADILQEDAPSILDQNAGFKEETLALAKIKQGEKEACD